MTARDPEDPAVAFEQMSRKLAGSAAAIDGFAVRQQELHARDYGPDLARILDRQEGARSAIDDLGKRPAMTLTLDTIASQIKAAGEAVRSDDHKMWRDACREQRQAADELKAIVISVRDARVWRWWIGAAAASAFLIGILACAILPGAVDRSVPASWH